MQFFSFALVFASAVMLSQIHAAPTASGLSSANTYTQDSHVLKRAASNSNTMDGNSTGGDTNELPEKTALTTTPDRLMPSTSVVPTDSSPKSTAVDPASEAKIKAAKDAITEQKKTTKAQWRKFKDEEEKLQKMINDYVVLEMKSFKPATMGPI
ncbi:uncharacterized protein MELLADRAFT_89259 [Melampsora larici-populina 98AG31]|uniref:Secreted protein n=1 Tax=Melampsora larici-populina (strain 98AG31 / pathotype 3-4-7) TaxID=747676 RepID=F4R5I9_MELLP|nr:uncharacterized protein MELLADRAFT_89259 [Melampsora larici-populina 98AG31]EGG12256.1 secreted protein [Melampsora larici-populina 98AG31]